MEDINKRKQQISGLYNYAMHYGLYMGLFLVFIFLCFVVAFHLQIFIFQSISIILLIIIPVLAYFFVKKFRDNILNGEIRFSLAWNFGTLMFFFASLILAITVYIFLEYITPSLYTEIISNLSQSVDYMIKNAGENNIPSQQIKLMQEQLALLSALPARSAIEMAVDNLGNSVFWGIIISIPIAIIVKSKGQRVK